MKLKFAYHYKGMLKQHKYTQVRLALNNNKKTCLMLMPYLENIPNTEF